jgi:hypothetical protein
MYRHSETVRQPKGLSRRLGVLAAFMVLAAATPARATGIQFAVFQQLPNAANPYTFTNNGDGTASFTGSSQVLFNFTSQSGADTTQHTLTLTINATTTLPGMKLGSLLDQTMNGQPGPVGHLNTLTVTDGTHNYLTMNFNGDIFGSQGTANATFSGDTQGGNSVTYSSDFLSFSTGSSFLIGLPTVTLINPGPNPNPPPAFLQGLQLGFGGLLDSFTTNAQGSFSANLSVPVPTSAVMFGTGLAATVVLSGLRKRRGVLSAE